MEDRLPNTACHYKYCVMSFGLTNTPATSQHFMNETFHDYLCNGVLWQINSGFKKCFILKKSIEYLYFFSYKTKYNFPWIYGSCACAIGSTLVDPRPHDVENKNMICVIFIKEITRSKSTLMKRSAN